MELTKSSTELGVLLQAMVAEDPVKAMLIAALDPATRRDLVARPPEDQDTMEMLAISFSDLDRYIRPWINERFRKVPGVVYARSAEVTIKTTFQQLLALCKPTPVSAGGK